MAQTARRSRTSRADVIQALIDVFRRCGYDGATLSYISEATGLGRASLYHHFPGGKQEMATAVLTDVGTMFGQMVLGPLRQSGSPRERLMGMSQGLAAFYGGGEKACLIGVFALADAGAVFRELIAQKLQGWIGAVAAVLEEAGLDPELARDRAEESAIAVQGSLILARGLGDGSAFMRVVEQLPDRLLAPVPQPSHSP
ncbi:MAG: TetR/AcrR family transcriptional regulator [Cyanobacteria bacterium P01_H01_bin.130]